MKLCTICDKKIEGTWCKNCHKFVKTYEISNSIYLNERHDPMNDKDCTYHTDTTKTIVRESKNTGTQRTYTSSTASGTSRSSAKKKGKKTALVAVLAYIIIMSLGIILPKLASMTNRISEGFREEIFEDEIYEEEIELSPEERQYLLDMINRNAALQELTPVYHVEEDDYEILYFDPEDIKGIGYPCDSVHFDMSFEEFETWLTVNWTDAFEYVDDISRYGNYYYASGDYSQVQFSCYRDYYDSDDFAVRVEYDTTTKHLHAAGVVARDDGMDMEFFYAMFKEFDPATEWSKDRLAVALKKAIEAGEYTTLYRSESVELWFEINEEAYSLVCYPVY